MSTQQEPNGQVPNYLVFSILVTVFGAVSLCGCCLPIGLAFGVVAIISSTQVDSKLRAGDIAGAVEASNKAKMWCFISLGASAVMILLGIAGMAFRMFGNHRMFFPNRPFGGRTF
jgi:hypothetical protein